MIFPYEEGLDPTRAIPSISGISPRASIRKREDGAIRLLQPFNDQKELIQQEQDDKIQAIEEEAEKDGCLDWKIYRKL